MLMMCAHIYSVSKVESEWAMAQSLSVSESLRKMTKNAKVRGYKKNTGSRHGEL